MSQIQYSSYDSPCQHVPGTPSILSSRVMFHMTDSPAAAVVPDYINSSSAVVHPSPFQSFVNSSSARVPRTPRTPAAAAMQAGYFNTEFLWRTTCSTPLVHHSPKSEQVVPCTPKVEDPLSSVERKKNIRSSAKHLSDSGLPSSSSVSSRSTGSGKTTVRSIRPVTPHPLMMPLYARGVTPGSAIMSGSLSRKRTNDLLDLIEEQEELDAVITDEI